MADKHDLTSDYNCPRCDMRVLTYIPHECNPDICVWCDGAGHRWMVNKIGECDKCHGTGKTDWSWPGEDQSMGASI